MSNNPTKRTTSASSATASIEEDFDFDIHFDKPIDPEHLEGAEELDDFHIDRTQDEEEHENFDFNSLDENSSEENEDSTDDIGDDFDFDAELANQEANGQNISYTQKTESEPQEDYNFDDEPNLQTQEEENDVANEEYDFDSEESIENYSEPTLEEELSELHGMSGVKMQTTQSLSGTPTQNSDEDEEYNFNNEDDLTTQEEVSDTENEEYDFDEDISDEENSDEDDFELEEFETKEEVPTSSKIAQMIHPKKNTETVHKKPKIDAKAQKVKKTLGNHIDFHKTKIILLAILVLISALWGYASQVGITTKSIPKFQNDTIKILKTQGVQMQYTLREKLIFHKAQTQIELNYSTTMEINGTTSLSSKLFSSLQHNLKNATFEIIDSAIKITSTGEINILNTIAELVNKDFSQMLEVVTIANTSVTVENFEGKITNNILIKKLEIKNTPQKSTITGTIITNSKPITVNYSYTKNSNLLDATIKSSAFNFNINATQKTFGTASKDSQTKGKAELSIKNIEEFVKIFGGSEKITNHLTNLPQFTIQFDFDYSSLNHELSITKGKINALNSIGLFTLKTTPDSYQATVNFETISITEIIGEIAENFKQKQTKSAKVETSKKEEKPNTKNSTKNNIKEDLNKAHSLHIFSVINPAKPLEISVFSKNISAQNEALFQNLETNLTITKENIILKNLNLQAGANLQIEGNGSMNNIQSNLASILNISISGSGNYKNIISKIVQLATDFEISKAITDETSVINLSIVHKAPATIIDTISIEIQDTLSLQGSTQFTEHFVEGALPSVFRSITISNTDFNNLKIDGISTPQGMTIFQSVINENAQNTSKTLSIVNSKFKDLTITQGTITKETQKDIISYNIEINTTDFILTNSTMVNIQQATPLFESNTFVQNVENMQQFYNTLRGIFNKDTISYPSFEKIDGNINLTLVKSKILSKPFEKIELLGTLKQGILTIPETKFSSTVIGTEKPLSGKLSGTVDLRRNVPVFDLQTTFVNAPMEEFKTILPFKTNIGGSIYGGGSIAFNGTTYTEFLNTLKLTTKFVVQDANFSKLNLDFIGQHLLKPHKNLSELDTDYIKETFEKDSKTKANFIFALNGEDKKFTIEDCTIKTAYSGGVCYGNVTINDATSENNKATVEVIAKFAIPALDINNGLKEIMKLYISSKIKQEGETCEITNDLSQVNKYTSYRRTTFSS